MRNDWLPQAMLRAASFLAPGDQRAAWLDGWRSELWYVPRQGAARFCLGAFQDALWLRQNNLGPTQPSGTHFESPLRCLAFLAALAAVSSVIAILLPGPKRGPWPSHLNVRDLPSGCFAMLVLTCPLLPAARFAAGRAPANRHPLPWRSRLRRGTFLVLKIALMQPIMLGGFVVLMVSGQVVPIGPQLGVFALWILAFRWALMDQRERCPVCLRRLTNPVRIGDSSHTFLEWYGTESVCSRGHGLQQIPELSNSYSGEQAWLGLDDSWNGLFSGDGARQR